MFRKSKFEIRTAVNGQKYFVLKSPNGKIILTSETYKTRDGLNNGIISVRINSRNYKSFIEHLKSDGNYYFVLRAKNNKIVGISEGYKTKLGRLIGILSVMKNAQHAVLVDESTNSGV